MGFKRPKFPEGGLAGSTIKEEEMPLDGASLRVLPFALSGLGQFPSVIRRNGPDGPIGPSNCSELLRYWS